MAFDGFDRFMEPGQVETTDKLPQGPGGMIFRDELLNVHGPQDELVAARWRQQRLCTMQTAGIDLEMYRMQPELENTMRECPESTRIAIAFTSLANQEKAMELLMRYETSYSRMHDRAMKSLQSLQ